jgi:adenine-specific DNA-methyltransferase
VRPRADDGPGLLAVGLPGRHNGCVIIGAGREAVAHGGPAELASAPGGTARAGLAAGGLAADGLTVGGLAASGPPVAAPAAERALARLAVRLGAARVAGWSAAEKCLAEAADAGSAVEAAEPGQVAGAVGMAAGGAGGAGGAVGVGGPAGAGWRAELAGLGDIGEIRAQIRAGADPLGAAFCRIRPPARRRPSGQTFTPAPVVAAMVGWAAGAVTPARVVDPGTGSARFLVAAGHCWPAAILAGVETDPLAAMIGRATLAAAGMAGRSVITLADYRSLDLPAATGPTLFLGNPPYVRHHQIPAPWKEWLKATAASQGLSASGLAGLHVHFLLATAVLARPGDAGVLITAAEWLDVNYGALARSLLLGPLGGEAVQLLDATLPVFGDAMTTAAITCFRPGRRPPSVRLRSVADLAGLADLAGGRPVPRAVLAASRRWTPLIAALAPQPPMDHPAGLGGADRAVLGGADGAVLGGADRAVLGGADGAVLGEADRAGLGGADRVELGELCRVHRGQVTGANQVWITAARPAGLPGRFLFPAVTRARELFGADGTLATAAGLRLVIDLPADLGGLADSELAAVTRLLAAAEAAGAAGSYIARHRTPWWRVRLRAPAPILASYMARRPPAFVRNLAGARHVNIAHGLYPREPLPPAALDGLAAYLRRSVSTGQGRTYAGGLTKFEPGEMERLPVPVPPLLPAYAAPTPPA